MEDVEDTADQSAIKLRARQLPSNALVLADPQPVNGTPPPLKVPSISGIKVGISSNWVQIKETFFHHISSDGPFIFVVYVAGPRVSIPDSISAKWRFE